MKHTNVTPMKTTPPLIRPKRLWQLGALVLAINLESAKLEANTISRVHKRTVDCGTKQFAKSAPTILLAEEVRWIKQVIHRFEGSDNLILDLTNDVAKTWNQESMILLAYLYRFGSTFIENPQFANQFLETISTTPV